MTEVSASTFNCLIMFDKFYWLWLRDKRKGRENRETL